MNTGRIARFIYTGLRQLAGLIALSLLALRNFRNIKIYTRKYVLNSIVLCLMVSAILKKEAEGRKFPFR